MRFRLGKWTVSIWSHSLGSFTWKPWLSFDVYGPLFTAEYGWKWGGGAGWLRFTLLWVVGGCTDAPRRAVKRLR